LLARFISLFNKHPVKLVLVLVWISLLFFTNSLQIVPEYGGFTFLGVIGAIFANATGAGGGVVFVPFFNQLSLSNETIVATSFAIQCCGMTAGAITWYRYYKSLENQTEVIQWQSLHKGLLSTVPASVLGILSAQFLLSSYTESVQGGLHLYFGIFSIVLAFAIYASIPFMKRQTSAVKLHSFDIIAVVVIGYGGGIVTAWLSVGVGELIAVYFILRGFNISFAIALAVIVSAFSVWSAISYHLFVSQAVYWQVVIFAGAGAIVGGIIAKHVVLFFSPIKLKIFFATWVLVMGLAGLPLWTA
jgi:uncharacterized membrane protein YfcA